MAAFILVSVVPRRGGEHVSSPLFQRVILSSRRPTSDQCVKRVRPSVAAGLGVTQTTGHSRRAENSGAKEVEKEQNRRKINSLPAGNSKFLTDKNDYR